MTRILLLSLAAAALLAGAVPARAAEAPMVGPEGQKAVKASRAFRYLDVFLKVPPAYRSKIRVSVYLRHDGKPAVGYHPVLIQSGGQRTPLPVNAQGRLETLPTLEQLQDKGALLTIDAKPEESFSAGLSIEPNMRPAQEMSAAQIDESLRSIPVILQKAVGPLAFLAPAFTRASFPRAVSGVAVSADGKETPLPTNEAGAPVYDMGGQKGAVRLRFAHVPARVELSPAK